MEFVKIKIAEEIFAPRDRALILFLLSSGCRSSEVSNLPIQEFNLEKRTAEVMGKGKRIRKVHFSEECAENRKAYLDNRDDNLPFVFVNTTKTCAMCTRTVQNKLKIYSKKLGIHITPHTLRHTFAAHLAMKGMPLDYIQVLLGHNGPHQTQLYARLYHQARIEIYDQWM